MDLCWDGQEVTWGDGAALGGIRGKVFALHVSQGWGAPSSKQELSGERGKDLGAAVLQENHIPWSFLNGP